MWLLNTARAELKFFPTPESVPHGYAILSHVWDEHEDTFQDIQNLCARCQETGGNPRDLVSPKVREFCLLAERHGYEWGWADTCCIDKTSSSELTEAINSMYRYYALSEICYAYLRDVPTGDVQKDVRTAFQESRWHRRGWTLQELIAPPLVLLLSRTWELLGSKADLAPLLEETTHVPESVLKLNATPRDFRVAARMGWAANRETTRPEDEAYCLMGIFGIFMPALYGEGKNAFRRLQEEIMRQSEDSSIFAWGEPCHLPPISKWQAWWSTSSVDLLASSPSDFHPGRGIVYEGRGTVEPKARPWYTLGPKNPPVDLSKSPTFNITPYGLVAHMPVLRIKGSRRDMLVAVLLGTVLMGEGSKWDTGLLLERIPDSPDPTRPLYAPCRLKDPMTSTRLLVGSISTWAERTGRTAKWRTIYIRCASPTGSLPVAGESIHAITGSLQTPFHIPQWNLRELLAHPTPNWHSVPWWNYEPLCVHIVFPPRRIKHREAVDRNAVWMVVLMGVCRFAALHTGERRHWAMVEGRDIWLGKGPEAGQHDCSQHHIDEWPNRTGVFTFDWSHTDDKREQLRVELSCKPYGPNPTEVRTVQFGFEVVPNPSTGNDPVDGVVRNGRGA